MVVTDAFGSGNEFSGFSGVISDENKLIQINLFNQSKIQTIDKTVAIGNQMIQAGLIREETNQSADFFVTTTRLPLDQASPFQ